MVLSVIYFICTVVSRYLIWHVDVQMLQILWSWKLMHEAIINYYKHLSLLWTSAKVATYTWTLPIVLDKTTFDLLGCWNLCQAKPVPWWDGTMCDKPRLWKGSWTEAANYRAGGAEGSTWITREFLLSDYQGRKGKFLLISLKLKFFSLEYNSWGAPGCL